MRPVDADALKARINTAFFSEIGQIIDDAPTVNGWIPVSEKTARYRGKEKQMERCDYCANRNSRHCEDGWNRTKNYDLCKYFELDWNTLKWKKQIVIQEMLMEEDEGGY